MSLVNDIRSKNLDAKELNKHSLETIRIVIETCTCPKDNLCVPCKNLLEFYRWKKKENEKHLQNAIDWIMHQCCLIFYGPNYKKLGLYFNKDIYTLKEVVELYEEFLRCLPKGNSSDGPKN